MARKNNQTKVLYSNKGVANNFGNYIEINKALKNNKTLRDYVVKHELGHKEEFDLIHEFKFDYKIMPFLLMFVIQHPSTWYDILPIQKRGKNIFYDLNLLILYGLIIISIIILIKIF